MSKRDGNQKGPQQHPQGGHGDRTHKAIVDQLKTGRDSATADADAEQPTPIGADGKHHIYEDRKQHDEADKNSEKDRLRHDRQKGRAG